MRDCLFRNFEHLREIKDLAPITLNFEHLGEIKDLAQFPPGQRIGLLNSGKPAGAPSSSLRTRRSRLDDRQIDADGSMV
jgi:hypothetical protein